MKMICLPVALFFILLHKPAFVHAQTDCKVVSKDLIGEYIGECKNGLANGKGEAKGQNRYKGIFKDGLPNGSGIYYYSDTVYYNGNFQDGIKEGKGEFHYVHKNMPDSVTKGYWSANEFRGTDYTTYKFTTNAQFDRLEISPSVKSGNSVSFEITTTSGAPNGLKTNLQESSGFVLSLVDLMSPSGTTIKKSSDYKSAFKSTTTYEVFEFPCKLFGRLSNDETFQLELYKSANWKIRIMVNR